MATSKKIDNDIMSVLSTLTSLSFFHFIANFAAIRKPNSGYIAYEIFSLTKLKAKLKNL